MKTMSLLVTLGLLLAACGSDEDSQETEASSPPEEVAAEETPEDADEEAAATEPTTTTSTTTTTTTTTEPSVAADEATDSAGGFSLMGFRYCEILITVAADDGTEVTEVWGTPGVDPCTDEAWYALDAATIQADRDASFVFMNGPRYFVVDGTVDTGDGTGTGTASGGETVLEQFGDITMSLLATTDAAEESVAYVPDLVDRTVTWTFEAGSEVYELTDPDGFVYTMQSYSLIEDRSLTAADLPSLGERLDLPDGWSYGSRVLDEPLQVALSPDGAVVVQDELNNSYQRNG